MRCSELRARAGRAARGRRPGARAARRRRGAEAHKSSDSYLQLDARPGALALRWDIALRDLDIALDLDAMATASSPGARCAPPGRASRPMRQRASRSKAVGSEPASAASSGAATVPMRCCISPRPAPCRAAGDPLLALRRGRSDPSRHRQDRAARPAGGALGARPGAGRRSARRPQAPPHRRRADQPPSPQPPSRWQFLAEGIHHILGGYDHVLFLLCLLLPAVMRRRDGRWQPVERLSQAILPVAGIVTAFTVAHSITLALAALSWCRCRRGSSSRRSR